MDSGLVNVVRVLKDIDRNLFKILRALDQRNQIEREAVRERITKPTIDEQDIATIVSPECSAEGDVIVYQGDTYQLACNEFVTDRLGGGAIFCIKRIGHTSKTHEAYDGATREEN